MSTREAVYPPTGKAVYENGGYAAAVKHGDTLYTAGIVGKLTLIYNHLFSSATGSLEDGSPEPDHAKQIALAFDNFEAVLKAGGSSFDDVLELTVYHALGEQIYTKYHQLFTGLLKKAFPAKPLPALAVVGVTWQYGFIFELKATAKISRSHL